MGNNRIVADASGAEAVQSTQYYPFGMAFAEGEGRGRGLQPYKYNGKELDETNGLNQYDYSARYYDPAEMRFTTIDPLAEKKPWLTPYNYCSNNPLNRVDPDGKDDYFWLTGAYMYSTESGSNIYVMVGENNVLLSNLNQIYEYSFKTATNIVGYYAEKAGVSYYKEDGTQVGDNPRGSVGIGYKDSSKEGSAIAYAKSGNIRVNMEVGGNLHELLYDSNNMVSVLVHENTHKLGKHGEEGDTRSELEAEREAYSAQVSHSSFGKTTKEFQKGILGNYASYLKESKASYSDISKQVDEFNKLLPRNSQYKLVFKANFQNFDIKVISNK